MSRRPPNRLPSRCFQTRRSRHGLCLQRTHTLEHMLPQRSKYVACNARFQGSLVCIQENQSTCTSFRTRTGLSCLFGLLLLRPLFPFILDEPKEPVPLAVTCSNIKYISQYPTVNNQNGSGAMCAFSRTAAAVRCCTHQRSA